MVNHTGVGPVFQMFCFGTYGVRLDVQIRFEFLIVIYHFVCDLYNTGYLGHTDRPTPFSTGCCTQEFRIGQSASIFMKRMVGAIF